MTGFIEFTKSASGGRVSLNVEEISSVTELLSDGRRTVIRMINADMEYVAESYDEVMRRIALLADGPPPVDGNDVLSIPSEWKSPLPRLQDGP